MWSKFNSSLPLLKSGSETSFGVNLLALAAAAGVTALGRVLFGLDPVELYVVFLVAVFVASVSLEALFFGRRSALLNVRVRRRLSWRRVVWRETALVVTLAAVGLAYWLFPAFSAKDDIRRWYFPFLAVAVPALLTLSVPYFCLMDRVDPEEEDATCRVGKFFWTRRRTMTRFELGNYVRSWLVKAFWLALMQPGLVEKIRVYMYYRWDRLLTGNPLEIYLFAATACYAIDLAYAATGYALNFKLVNTHVRTAEPTLLGWIAALACYWPFWALVVHPQFLAYESVGHWHDTLFAQGSCLWWTWAGVIVLCELVYALATVAAGIRFSNLTYRGLWNTGPYRWTKHPAYVFKVVSWFFLTAPFLLNTGFAAVKSALLLVLLAGVYYLRAKTEERHLSHYPEYVAYALEMNERSIFRWCARVLPFLKYKRIEDRG